MIKKLIWILLIIFPISNSFGNVTFNQTETFFDDGQDNINGLTFNGDGTKIFIITSDDGSEDFVSEYTLSTPCLLYTSPSPRDPTKSRMPSSA